MVVFERPIGAVADVKELEYVSALHQTAKLVRRDGSIDATDIKVYLRSRFGIEVTHRQVCDTILQGMGGGSDDEEVLDLMEMVAILLIPVLLKATCRQRGHELEADTTADTPPANLIDFVREMIVFDVVGETEISSATPPELTVDLLQKIFEAYGEEELARDEKLLQSMIVHAQGVDMEADVADKSTTHTGGGAPNLFDMDTFAAALTNDVTLFNIHNETRASNVYMDVFEGEPGRKSIHAKTSKTTEHDLPEPMEVTHIYTAPSIDSTAGTYRSKTLLVTLWAGTLFCYYAFIRPNMPSPNSSDCTPYVRSSGRSLMNILPYPANPSWMQHLFFSFLLLFDAAYWRWLARKLGNHG